MESKSRAKDMSGVAFGRLTVVEFSHSDKNYAWWRCVCECGGGVVTRGASLRSGRTQSCGCLAKERRAAGSKKALRTHGHASGAGTRTYRIWTNMISRCTNKRFDSYPYYGGRGIEVCERWKTFVGFLVDMGAAGDGMSIDRIDCNGNYEPGNCRWVKASEQSKNRRNIKRVTFRGREIALAELAEMSGLRLGTLWSRLNRGWSVEDAVKPVARTIK